MKSIVKERDMRLMERIFRYESPEALPIAFEYDGRVIHGVPAEFSPQTERRQIDANLVLHTVTARIDENLELRVELTEYRDYAATELVAYFTNIGGADTRRLKNVRVVDAVLAGEHPVLYHGNGDTCREDGYEWYRTPLTGTVEMKTVDGTSCNGAFPYMRLLFDGFGVNIGVGWPVNWSAEIGPAASGARISIGQPRFDMVIHPGETMRTPRVNFVAYDGEESRGINMWRRWYFAHILPREDGQPLPPKCCMHTFAAGGHPEFTGITEQNQLDGIDDYLRAGVRPDIWWIDAGWYPCHYDWPHIGTWKPDYERLPNGLGPVGRKCRENGIRLLLWFEPERARDHTELTDEHPEWMLRMKNPDGTYSDNSLVNLGDPACCDWVIDRVDSIIKDSGVDIYRQDFNFAPAEYWRQNEAEDRIGALENLHAQGYLRYWDALLERNPGLWIDSCASGGRRNDLETMRRAVPLHYTDVGYGNHPIKQKQHRQMFEWIPYFRAHNMSWDRPDGSYVPGEFEKRELDEFAFYAAMAPSLTDMTEHDASPEGMALAIRMQKIWRRAAELMLSCDYYPLTECRKSPRDFYAMQFHNPDTGEGFFQVLSNTQTEEEAFVVRLPALEDGEYVLSDSRDGSELTCGAEQLRQGFRVALPRRSSVIYFYHRA